jgi:alkanesulfonate monooxygenase SsuD/methylene tetrahydromethanopterin reductase-like flavin-dependent oxidoreductase (luciferase family)
MHLALEIDRDGGLDIEELATRVREAEAAGFALVTIGDAPGGRRIEAGVRAAFLSRRTDRIGLAPTLHATLTEPFHLATQLASLDHASLGRGGWVVGAANDAAAHATIGSTPLDDAGLRREVADVIDVARQLWDSWEDDAVLRDTTTGRFLDPDRVHHVAFTGARFTVTGPLITPRPPQGQLVVLGADTLGVTGRLDVALIAAPTAEELATRAARARDEGAPLVFAELEVTARDAPSLLDRLAATVDGVRLHPASPAELPRLIEALATGNPAGPTLRDTLGLPRPANRYAVSA